MAKQTRFDDFKDLFKKDKKVRLITYVSGGVVVLIAGYFLYNQFIYAPKNTKANENIYKGLNLADKDSTDAAIAELEPFVKKYDGKQGGEIAQFTLARQYMSKGDFKKALNVLDGVKLKDTYGPAMVLGLQGDCYSEMQKYKDALGAYTDAANADENEFTTPTYLFKAGQVAEELNDFATAKEMYERINKDFYQFGQQKQIDKYIARAENKIK
jgi:predicted negative regulator of RcsB-dependent stress response